MSTRSKTYIPFIGIAVAATATTIVAALYYKLIHQSKKIDDADDEKKEGSKATNKNSAASDSKDEKATFLANARSLLSSDGTQKNPTEGKNQTKKDDGEQAKEEEKNPLAKMWKNLTDKKPTDEEVVAAIKSAEHALKEQEEENKKSFWFNLMKKKTEDGNAVVVEEDSSSSGMQGESPKSSIWDAFSKKVPKEVEAKVDEKEKEVEEGSTKIFGITIGPPATKKPAVSVEINNNDENKKEVSSSQTRKTFFGFGGPKFENFDAAEEGADKNTQKEEPEKKPESVKKLFGFSLPYKNAGEENELVESRDDPVVKKIEFFGFERAEEKDSEEAISESPKKNTGFLGAFFNPPPMEGKQHLGADKAAPQSKAEEESKGADRSEPDSPKKKQQSFAGAFFNPPPPGPRIESDAPTVDTQQVSKLPDSLPLTEATD